MPRRGLQFCPLDHREKESDPMERELWRGASGSREGVGMPSRSYCRDLGKR